MLRDKTGFPDNIKKSVLCLITQSASGLTSEIEVANLFTKQISFLGDNENLTKVLRKFLGQAALCPILSKNLSFCYPRSFSQPNEITAYCLSLGDPVGDILDIFDDFILHTTRLIVGKGDGNSIAEHEWTKFESEFFSDIAQITFIAPLARFYYQAGGIIENLVPRDDIAVRYLDSQSNKDKSISYTLRGDLDFAKSPCAEEFSYASAIVAEYIKTVDKQEKLEEHFHEAAGIFEKITLLLRVICGGSVHFGFIRPFFMGHYADNSYISQSYLSNHLFSSNRESTILRSGPDETWFRRAWAGIDQRDISEWQFANQKLRDSYSRAATDDKYYFFDPSYRMSRQLERLVDLVQALEFTMGDYLGGKYIGEYIGKLISRGNTEKEKVIGDEVLALFTIRSKYLHGKPKGEDSVEKTFRSKFQGRIELLEEAVDRLEHYLKQTLLVSILNAGFKEKISAYHESHGRLTVSFIKKPADLNPIDFPEFKTIYY